MEVDSSTAVVRAAPSASSSTQPSAASSISVFRHPFRAPQGWSLTPTRMVEAAERSMQWIADGKPQLQARAQAVHSIRCKDRFAPQGAFLRTLKLTSAMMSADLLHEVLLVQNLVLQWSDEEDDLATSAWPQVGAEVNAGASSTSTATAVTSTVRSVAGPSLASGTDQPNGKRARTGRKAATGKHAVDPLNPFAEFFRQRQSIITGGMSTSEASGTAIKSST